MNGITKPTEPSISDSVSRSVEHALVPLRQLRRARSMSQSTLAQRLEMDQGNLSKLEQRPDMFVSTLRRYVEAMGGTLEIMARFGDDRYSISRATDARDD